ncbi:MAG: 2-amino-4-ketopentanoate thiolase [Firmicutes bacterium]|nr:2-amino-4-ketopentanoate thiolase [Bacillota bacterium]
MGRAGDWVQVYDVLLKPGERAPQVPEDTQGVPLEMRVKGFLEHDAMLGDHATVRTMTGRLVEGTLVAINPAYPHDFGQPVLELLVAGEEFRALLEREAEAQK